MPLQIAVTGGAGYIGSILVPELLALGHRVRVLDSFRYGEAGLVDCCHKADFEIVRGDCRDREAVSQLIRDADLILPLAAVVGEPACRQDTVAATTTNFDAVRLLLSLRSPEQGIVFPCTNSGYGIGEEGKFCTEDSPLRPISLYGRTKVDAEQAVLDARNSLSVRLATVFGASPRMRIDLLVNDFVYRAVSDRTVVIFEGHFKRNYIHIRDVACAFVHSITNFETMAGRAYNVGLSDANLSKLELCAKIKEYVPGFVYLEAPIGKDPDRRNYIVSNERVEATGYRAKYTLDDGIQELIKAFQILRPRSYRNV